MTPKQWKTVNPFIWAAAFWGLAGGCADLLIFREGVWGLAWFVGLWCLCLLDLVSLTLLIQASIRLVVLSKGKQPWILRGFFWGTAKVACIAAIIAVLIAGKDAPRLSLLLGSSTLVVVPLFGGVLWGLKNLRNRPYA